MHGYPLFRALLLSVDFAFSAPPSYYAGIVREEHPVAKHDDVFLLVLRGEAREKDEGEKRKAAKRESDRKEGKE